MKLHFAIFFVILFFVNEVKSQKNADSSYSSGFMSLQLIDSSRTYKPGSAQSDRLHYRPLELDIWYPSSKVLNGAKPLKFGDLFQLFEERANTYQEETDYSGMVEELAMFYVAELGVDADGRKLLEVKTSSFKEAETLVERFPLVLYMAGFNGMGFENYRLLENLAKKGFVVVSMSSVGRYPGDMTNELADTMEQVYDAEFVIKYLQGSSLFNLDMSKIGVLGTSWGGMGAVILANRQPNIKAMLSLDGSETHYFGDSSDINNYANGASWQDNDRYIQEIYDSQFKGIENLKLAYLYFESGDKLDDFTPTEEYHFYKKLDSEKYYLRFENSEHANFSCIPAILNTSEDAVAIYDHLDKTTSAFFLQHLKEDGGFESWWSKLSELEYTTTIPFDIKNLKKSTKKSSEVLGRVIDAKSGYPLPYVNVGVLNGATGTVSDTLGYFSLRLEDDLVNDTLRVSRIGYQAKDFLLKKIINEADTLMIGLTEEISELNEVVVSAKAFKKRTLGNKTESKFLGTGFGYDQLGAEMGIKINIRKNPTFVDAFNFTISHNRLSAKSTFRLNFYTVEKGRPSKNIVKDNILVPIEPKQTGKVTIDLRPYDIILKDDVIVALEWVANEGENKKDEAIFFPLGLMTNGTLYKYTYHSKFKKFGSLGVGFNIDVRFY